MFQSWNRAEQALALSLVVGGEHGSAGNMVAQALGWQRHAVGWVHLKLAAPTIILRDELGLSKP
jgi:hypothetical protein